MKTKRSCERKLSVLRERGEMVSGYEDRKGVLRR